VIAGRRQETLDETLALAVNVDGQDSGCLVSIQSDVSDPDSVEAA